jgi:mediator of RNA polymerase II transcription subunit 12
MEQKNVSFDPFRTYSTISHFELPPDLSPEYRLQLRALLPFAASNTTVSNLVSAQLDSNGKFIHGSPVLNRPWEWIENLGDLPVPDPKEDEKGSDKKARLGMRYLVRNTASLSLETFGARITGDGVIHNVVSRDDPTADANIRTFEDGLSAESIFERDWRQSRMAVGYETAAGASRPKGDTDESDSLQAFARRTPTPRQPSPMSSGRSMASTNSFRQSPGSAAIGGELVVPDVGAITNTATSTTISEKVHKRKADSGDEITVIENPGFEPGRLAKKAKHKSSTSRTKKR